MTISQPAVDNSGEHELTTIAAELERYWSEQWRRAKEICDLLEQRLALDTAARPRLHLVATAGTSPEEPAAKDTRPPLRIVDA
jgi:hypothetical protein